MKLANLKAIVERATQRLVDEQRALLELKVGEPTIAQHIAGYIREQIPKQLSVDVEYNKHLTEKKVLLLPPKGSPNANPIPTVVRPDIVIHKRGTDRQNVVALEVKKPGANLAHDRVKLEAFKQQYGYLLAGHIIVGLKGAQPISEVRWVD